MATPLWISGVDRYLYAVSAGTSAPHQVDGCKPTAVNPREALIYWLRGRIAASRGARKLAYLHDMSRFLRAGLLALHPARRINQRFPSSLSDSSDRREPSRKTRPDLLAFEAHSGAMQRESGQKWAVSPTGTADQPQARQTARAQSVHITPPESCLRQPSRNRSEISWRLLADHFQPSPKPNLFRVPSHPLLAPRTPCHAHTASLAYPTDSPTHALPSHLPFAYWIWPA